MSGNSIAISRELLAAGMEQAIASAVAEAIVTHSDERHATREDLVKMEATIKEKTQDEINALRNQLSAFEAETRAFQANAKAFQAQTEAKLDGIRREMNSRFNILSALIVGSAVVIFFKDYLG